MDFQKIETLLERYWACETSLEEERFLKDFFAGNNIPQSLSEYAPFFTWKQENAALQAGEGFSRQIEQKLQNPERKKQPVIVKYFYPTLKIAASVLIVVTVGLGIHTHNRNQAVLLQAYSETFTDPEQAMEEVNYALNKISTSLLKAQSVLEGITDNNPADLENEIITIKD